MNKKLQEFIKKDEVQIVLQILTRGLILVLFGCGIKLILADKEERIQSFLFLLSSGMLNGINYGFHNHQFLHENTESTNVLHRSHIIWIHMISGLVSATVIYLEVIRLKSMPISNVALAGQDFVLLFIAMLGYGGFLPMIMFFFSHSVQTIETLIMKNKN